MVNLNETVEQVSEGITSERISEMDFLNFKAEVQNQFNKMKNYELFRVQVDKDTLWDTYLNSFPEGNNHIFRERREYDCNSCKQFIRSVGNMVAVIDGEIQSIWDIQVEDGFQVVADALSALVKSYPIENIFLHIEGSAGIDKNYQLLESGETLTWEHLYIRLPKSLVESPYKIDTQLAHFRSIKEVMFRGLSEITMDSMDTTLDLIAQNSLYRGEEHTFVIESFRKLKDEFDKLTTIQEKEIFCWTQVISIPESVSKIRNTVIGTLLTDISEGKDLEKAVTSFETKVAPTNYKRPTAVISKAMIESAKNKVEELGFTSALQRRFATLEDITINNILFADREARKRIDNVFDELSSKVSDNVRNFDKVEEVSIDQFITKILPTAHSLEIMFENKHIGNLVSLIAPVDPAAKGMFKWFNNFSWSYNGELTDAIKERVKKAGGRVEGDLRCSLSWFNYDDLDLHMVEPEGYKIFYQNRGRLSPSGGTLDVDMNAGSGSVRDAVENIVYPDRNKMKEGLYILQVNNFFRRESIDVGFDVEVEFDRVTYTFSYDKPVKDKETITVAEIKYSWKDGFTIVKSLPSSQTVKQIWSIPTQTFHKVSVALYSPNHWDEKAVGNKHYFFMLDGCLNDGKARGFFNEFLNEELNVHRKVLEVVGAGMKTEESTNQLSGLGFSSTQRNSLLCRVKGNFSRIIKILF